METITITEAKRSLGRYLKRAAAGEDIGILSGADIILLRKIEVTPVNLVGATMPSGIPDEDDWPVFEPTDGGPVDGALNHDRYLYDATHGKRAGGKIRP